MKSFRDLLPAPAGAEETQIQSIESSSSSSARRRQPTKIACTPCRKRKSKCDGRRPACSLCASGGLASCEYDGDPDESRANALKRKHDELQRRVEILQELFKLLTIRPEEEALAILQRMRTSDPETDLEVLVNLIKSGDLLLKLAEASTTQNTPDSGETGELFIAESPKLPENVTALIRIINAKVAELDEPSRKIFTQLLGDRQAAPPFSSSAGMSGHAEMERKPHGRTGW